jgi:hypothetical protein
MEGWENGLNGLGMRVELSGLRKVYSRKMLAGFRGE